MPPPPADALIMTGYPIWPAAASAAVTSATGSPGARRHRHASRSIRLRALILSPICSIESGAGPTQVSPAPMTLAAKTGLSAQEAVARMDRRSAGLSRRGQYRVRVQVAASWLRGPDEHRRVGLADIRQVSIGHGVDSHRADAELTGAGDDPPGYLTTISDKDRFEHARQPTSGTGPGGPRPRPVPTRRRRRTRSGQGAAGRAPWRTCPGRSSCRPCRRRRWRP